MDVTNDDQSAFEYLTNDVLSRAEEIAWTGHPDPVVMARAKVPSACLGLLNLAIAGFMIYVAPSVADLGFATVLLVGSLVAGIYLLAAPYRAWLRAWRTYYAITSRRVLILRGDKTFKVISILGPDIEHVETSHRSGGTGNIALRGTTTRDQFGSPIRQVTENDGLWAIDEVAKAAAAIKLLRVGL